MATILGIISLASLGAVLFLTYQKGGEATPGYGLTGILATVFSVIGLVLGILTAREKKYYRFFPLLGIVLNGLVLLEIGFILYLGVKL